MLEAVAWDFEGRNALRWRWRADVWQTNVYWVKKRNLDRMRNFNRLAYSLGWGDPEEEMATHSGILAWEIQMDGEACGL